MFQGRARVKLPSTSRVSTVNQCEKAGPKLKPLQPQSLLGGGFKYFLFTPLFGEDSQFD